MDSFHSAFSEGLICPDSADSPGRASVPYPGPMTETAGQGQPSVAKKTPKREREAPDLGAMLGRMTRALVRRAADGETEALLVLVELNRQAAEAVADAARGLHDAGLSYEYLAAELGVSKQAVMKRVKRRAPLCGPYALHCSSGPSNS